MASPKALAATSYLFSERLIRMLVGFFIHAWLARYLSAEDFGRMSYVVKSVFVYYSFGLFGVDEIVIRELLRRRGQEADVLQTVLRLRLFCGAVGWGAMLVLTVLLVGVEHDTFWPTVLFGLTIPLQAFAVYELPHIAHSALRPVFVARNSSYGLSSLAKCGAILSGAGRNLFIGIYGLEELMWKGAVYVQAMARGWTGGRFQAELARLFIRSGALHFAAGFVVLFDQRLPFLLIERFHGAQAVGHYAIAVALIDMGLLLPISLATGLFSPAVQAREASDGTYDRRIQLMADVLVWLGVAFAGGVWVCSPGIVDVLYHGKYQDAVPLFQGLAVVCVWNFFNIGRFKWLAVEEGLREWLILSSLCMAIQFVFLWHWLPSHGVAAVIASSAVSQCLGNLLMLPFSSHLRRSLVIFLRTFGAPFRYWPGR